MREKLKKISPKSWIVIKNMMGSFVVKGVSLLISVFLLPAYIQFFDNQVILGIWYTMLSVLNWVNMFDLGLGHGLRNKLPALLESQDKVKIRQYISTTYLLMTGIALVVAVVGWIVMPYLDLNKIFNVGIDIISNTVLVKCTRIVFLGIIIHLVVKIITFILYALQKSALTSVLLLISNLVILVMIKFIPSRDLVTNLETMSVINVVAINLPYIVCTIWLFCRKLRYAVPSFKFYKKELVKDIFQIGMSLFWLQLVFMVISSANEIVITKLTNPESVVQYQAYYKIFKTAAMVVSLALTPVWSAVTKAQAQGDYAWIKKIYKLFLAGSLACFVIELCVIPILQPVMDLWLGEGTIDANAGYALAFAVSSALMVLHNVNTTVGNGLSYFKLQMIWMTFAAVVFVPLSYLFVEVTGSWIGVVIANSIALIPYEVLAPFFTMKILSK